MQFRNICDTYGISREASREFVYLFKSTLKDNEHEDCVQLGMLCKSFSFWNMALYLRHVIRKNPIHSVISWHYWQCLQTKDPDTVQHASRVQKWLYAVWQRRQRNQGVQERPVQTA